MEISLKVCTMQKQNLACLAEFSGSDVYIGKPLYSKSNHGLDLACLAEFSGGETIICQGLKH
jgi:hypothetical protein